LVTSFVVNIISVCDCNPVYSSLDVQEGCTVEIHMAVDDASETVARGSLHFSDLLRFPQKKFHSTVPLAGTRSCEAINEFGIIECWFTLSCSVNLVSSFIRHRTKKVIQCVFS
jgi:hypothetical protein